jgi:hypothetical protein
MTNPEYRSKRSAMALGVTLLASVAFVAGCDTVALVSFQNRNFTELHSAGFISPSGDGGSQCGSLGTDRQAQAKLRFVMLDDGNPTRPYTPEDGTILDVNPDLAPGLSNGAVFEPRDLSCQTMPNPEMCDLDDYDCADVVSGSGEADDPELARCNASTNFEINSNEIRFVSNVEDGRDNALGVVVEHGATTRGSFPPSVSGDWYDSDGNNQGDTQFSSVDPDRASDRRGRRLTAINQFIDAWVNVAAVSEERRGATTHFGLWALNDGDNAVSAVNSVDGGDQPTYWSSPTSTPGNKLDSYVDEVDTRIEQTDNLVQPLVAATDLINGPFRGENNDSYDDADKSLFLIVDGPPELPLSSTANLDLPDDLIEAANDNGVRIHIIHFDPAFDDLSLFPDSLPYWDEQSENCSSDADCEDWETCREVNGFSDTQGGEVSPEPSGSYCMTDRREKDGRYGPISVYGQIACATGGSYQYLKSNYSIQQPLGWLPYETDGLWEADVQIGRINDGEVEFGGPSRIQANFEVSVNEQTESVNFSQEGYSYEGEPTGGLPDGARDNRSTIFIDDQN